MGTQAVGARESLIAGAGDTAEAVSVVVGDDYPLYVEALGQRLETDPRFRLLGVAATGPDVLAVCRRTLPRVALVGYHLPGLGGVALITAILQGCPETSVVALGGVIEPELVHTAVSGGARGYLAKREPGDAVLDALHRVGRGEPAFSAAAASSLVRAIQGRSDASGVLPSPREIEILRLLAGGATSKVVGEKLFVSEATVKTYLQRIYSKLSVNDRAAAVAEAMRRGWLD